MKKLDFTKENAFPGVTPWGEHPQPIRPPGQAHRDTPQPLAHSAGALCLGAAPTLHSSSPHAGASPGWCPHRHRPQVIPCSPLSLSGLPLDCLHLFFNLCILMKNIIFHGCVLYWSRNLLRDEVKFYHHFYLKSLAWCMDHISNSIKMCWLIWWKGMEETFGCHIKN